MCDDRNHAQKYLKRGRYYSVLLHHSFILLVRDQRMDKAKDADETISFVQESNVCELLAICQPKILKNKYLEQF